MGLPRIRLNEPGEVRETLLRMRRALRWSRPTLALALGTSPQTLRRWEDGTRRPSGAARRLIWLIDRLVGDPQKVATMLDMLTWGRSKKLQELLHFLDAKIAKAEEEWKQRKERGEGEGREG